MIKGFLKVIWYDIKNTYNSMSKPKEVMNLLFFLSMGFLFLGLKKQFVISLVLFFLVYMWKIYRTGHWRNG